jgi:hypothetical protein
VQCLDCARPTQPTDLLQLALALSLCCCTQLALHSIDTDEVRFSVIDIGVAVVEMQHVKLILGDQPLRAVWFSGDKLVSWAFVANC